MAFILKQLPTEAAIASSRKRVRGSFPCNKSLGKMLKHWSRIFEEWVRVRGPREGDWRGRQRQTTVISVMM